MKKREELKNDSQISSFRAWLDDKLANTGKIAGDQALELSVRSVKLKTSLKYVKMKILSR